MYSYLISYYSCIYKIHKNFFYSFNYVLLIFVFNVNCRFVKHKTAMKIHAQVYTCTCEHENYIGVHTKHVYINIAFIIVLKNYLLKIAVAKVQCFYFLYIK